MNALVVGGAGFLGSHLVDALLARGDQVTVLDNMITGRQENLDSAADAQEHGYRFHYLFGDVTTTYLDGIHPTPDLIFHLASPASPEAYWRHPLETLDANVVGTRRLVEYAIKYGIRLLYTSSSEVYGNALVVPQPETYFGNVNPIGPRCMYDEGKRFAESLIATAVTHLGLNAKIVRLFNAYGPRMNPYDGRAVPTFIRQALAGDQLTVHAPGSQTRCFCWVGDIVRGILAVAGYEGWELVFNLGNPHEVPVAALAQLIAVLADGKDERTFHPVIVEGRQEEIARRVPDIGRAWRLLGWKPEVGLEDGLQRTIDWYKERV